jgi:biotin carboxylase
MTRGHVIVVDPYSSGVLYAPALRRAGFSPVAVRSVPFPHATFTDAFRPDDFDVRVTADGDFDDLAHTLGELRPVAVLPGSESGVELADRLAARLTPRLANAPELSRSRRHKGLMAEAVRAAGLPVAPTVCVRDPADAEDRLAGTDFAGHDLVVKPSMGVSTDGVTLAPGGSRWRPLAERLLGRTNATGVVDREVVIQRRLFGTEYAVNTFSHDGRHTVTDICRYEKAANGDSFAVYKGVEFLPMDGPHHEELIDYVRRALDAVGFRFGPAHTEVMLTDDGPRLIEVNSRVAGSGMAAAAELATGDNGVHRVIRYLLGHRDFPAGYTLDRTVKVAMFVAPRSGTVTNAEAFERIRALPTCRHLRLNVRNGDRIAATSDLLSSVRFGWALLAHREAERVHRDYARARSFAAQMHVATYPRVTPGSPG